MIVEKYEYVGRLLRPGEEPNSYSDEEEESSESVKASKTEDITNITDAAATKKDEWLIWPDPINHQNNPSNSSSNQIKNDRDILAANGTKDQRNKQ